MQPPIHQSVLTDFHVISRGFEPPAFYAQRRTRNEPAFPRRSAANGALAMNRHSPGRPQIRMLLAQGSILINSASVCLYVACMRGSRNADTGLFTGVGLIVAAER